MNDNLDLEKLQWEIRAMQRWSPLYKLLKSELTALGYWKNLPRGNPKEAYKLGWGRHNKKHEQL
jgi:hypothetical protein